ncbi:hypothetical protein SALBM311S_02517 [Streptomyces alboniger]
MSREIEKTVDTATQPSCDRLDPLALRWLAHATSAPITIADGSSVSVSVLAAPPTNR